MNVEMRRPREITEILNMPKGSRIVYHVGLLSKDRGDVNKTPAEQEISDTANIAWKLHEQGKVCLVQRRLGFELYEYIAQRR